MVLLLALTACSSGNVAIGTIDTNTITQASVKEEAISDNSIENVDVTYQYTIAFVDTSEMLDLSWANDLSFDVVQIQDMPV